MKIKLLFFVWPFFSLIESVRLGFKERSHGVILTWFCGFIGLNFAVQSESPDINRYRDEFLDYGDRNFNYFFSYLSDYIGFKAKHYDILTEVINFTLSRFTDNPYFLYLIFGLIFGFFYSSVIRRIGKINHHPKILDYLLLLSLLLIISPTKGINQFRFYTASIIFADGILSYILDKNKKKLLYLPLSLLTHVGMTLPIVGFVLYFLMRKLNYKIIILILILVLLGGFSISYFEPIFNSLGGAAQSKYLEYSGEQIDERMQGFRERIWYAAYMREIVVASLFLPFLQIITKSTSLKDTEKKLFTFILFLTITVALSINTFMYHRYFDILGLFLIFFIAYYYAKYNDVITKRCVITISPVLLFMVLVNITEAIGFISSFTFINNIFTVWLFQNL